MNNKFTLLLLLILIAQNLLAQTVDKITKTNGETIEVNIKKVTDTEVEFSFINEDLLQTINKSKISQITYKSGRTEKYRDIVSINGENDWEQVVLTTIEADVAGLTRVSEVTGKHSILYGGQTKLRTLATEKIKREAAKLNCHIVFIQSDKFAMTPINNVSIVGIAYK
jgi:hypothetical protein